MRNWKSTKSPDGSLSVWKPERSFVGNDHVDAAPTKNPFGIWNVRPTVAALKLRSVEIGGATDPSAATSTGDVKFGDTVTLSWAAFSPVYSVVRRRGPRLGNPAPTPHLKPLDSWTLEGLPRKMPPA